MTEPFYGRNQGGIVTALQNHTYFAAFDLVTDRVGDVVAAAARLDRGGGAPDAGQTARPLDADASVAAGRTPARRSAWPPPG